MSAGDVQRAKYARLMAEVAGLEERVLVLERQLADEQEPADAAVTADELRALQERLAQQRAELARLSDGCGRPHPMT